MLPRAGDNEMTKAAPRPPEQKGSPATMARYDEGPGLFGYLFRFVLIVVLLAALGLVAFAFFGDLSLPATPQRVPLAVPALEG